MTATVIILPKRDIGCGIGRPMMPGFVSGGSITIWLSLDKIDSWKAPKREGRGGELVYSDNAIEAMLMLGAVYHLPLRQTHGLTKSVFELLGLDLPVASIATLCRRRKALSIEPWVQDMSEPLDIVLDGTGLKIYGQGEWCRIKHGKKRRGWKKLHVGLDANSGMIVSHILTDKDAGDPDQIDDCDIQRLVSGPGDEGGGPALRAVALPRLVEIAPANAGAGYRCCQRKSVSSGLPLNEQALRANQGTPLLKGNVAMGLEG